MSISQPLSHVYSFIPGSKSKAPPLLLLHGTGGDENDLLPLGQAIAPGASLLSPRGKALEGGMPRFFRRLAEGVFDQDDVRRRANELADFILEARAAFGLAAPIAVGLLERRQYRCSRAVAAAGSARRCGSGPRDGAARGTALCGPFGQTDLDLVRRNGSDHPCRQRNPAGLIAASSRRRRRP